MPKATKICSKCKQSLPLSSFSVSKTHSQGRQAYCKVCRKIRYQTNKKSEISQASSYSKAMYTQAMNSKPDAIRYWIRHRLYSLSKDKELRYAVSEKLYKKWLKNPYCPYTGVRLIPACNMHLDHIEPRSLRPDLSIDHKNLRWVSADYNIARQTMSDELFYHFCLLVVKNYPKTLPES